MYQFAFMGARVRLALPSFKAPNGHLDAYGKVVAHAVVEAKAEAAEGKAAVGKEELRSFAFLGGRDLFYQLNFTGPSSSAISAMKAVKIDWTQWPSSGIKT